MAIQQGDSGSCHSLENPTVWPGVSIQLCGCSVRVNSQVPHLEHWETDNGVFYPLPLGFMFPSMKSTLASYLSA